jgi:dTDP-4-amino-4,6-dideoxygalactose transaminase
LLEYDNNETNNYQYIVVQIRNASQTFRDQVVNALKAENILARRYFWPGCHRMLPYRQLFPNASRHLQNSETVADSVVVLPTGVAVDESAVETIVSIFRLLITSKKHKGITIEARAR